MLSNVTLLSLDNVSKSAARGYMTHWKRLSGSLFSEVVCFWICIVNPWHVL